LPVRVISPRTGFKPPAASISAVRVAIAGGHGQIALRLTRLLSGRGDEVLSLIRNPDHAEDVRQAGGEALVCDLEAASADEVAALIGSADAVVFAAGAGPGSGPARKETMDYGGAVKLIRAAKAAGIARYVMVSAMGADPDAAGGDTFSAYLRAKGLADAELAASGLDHTILRPGGLTDDPGTGRVRLGAQVPSGQVPRDDVAAVLAELLRAPATVGSNLALTSGDRPVAEAVASPE
jgi:uncharacterized protein YbjT (DUF2867 family)